MFEQGMWSLFRTGDVIQGGIMIWTGNVITFLDRRCDTRGYNDLKGVVITFLNRGCDIKGYNDQVSLFRTGDCDTRGYSDLKGDVITFSNRGCDTRGYNDLKGDVITFLNRDRDTKGYNDQVSLFRTGDVIQGGTIIWKKMWLLFWTGDVIQVGLARTVFIHRIWPYIWWFPCQTIPCVHRIYRVLANPKYKGVQWWSVTAADQG